MAATSKSSSKTTLTQVTYFTRIMVIYGLIAIILILLLKIAYDSFNAYLASQRCLSPDAVNRVYNSLPPLSFPRQSSIQKPEAYFLRLTGQPLAPDSNQTLIPETPPKLLTQLVYPTQANTTTLAADKRVREIASVLGFSSDPTQISGDDYRWSQGGATLRIDRRTLKTEYNSSFMTNNEFLNRTGKTLPTNSEATQLVKDKLTEMNLLPQDMASGSAKITHLKAVGSELITATSISEADFVQVALQRQPLTQETTDERCEIVTKEISFVQPANTPSSIVAVIARDFLDTDHLVQLDYHYQAIDQDFPGRYNARTLEQAWQVVQSGEAYIAQPSEDRQVTITSYSVGYFEALDEQPYFQPVYIFYDDFGFEAYVSAISPVEIDQNWYLNQENGYGNFSLSTATGSATTSTRSATPSSTINITNPTTLNPTPATSSVSPLPTVRR